MWTLVSRNLSGLRRVSTCARGQKWRYFGYQKCSGVLYGCPATNRAEFAAKCPLCCRVDGRRNQHAIWHPGFPQRWLRAMGKRRGDAGSQHFRLQNAATALLRLGQVAGKRDIERGTERGTSSAEPDGAQRMVAKRDYAEYRPAAYEGRVTARHRSTW